MKLISFFVFVLLLGHGQISQAEMGLAGVFGVRQNSSQLDRAASTSSAKSGTQVGAILTWPILPLLSLRTGIISANRDLSFSSTVFGSMPVTVETTEKANYIDIPVNLQLNLPIIDLYAFSGVTYAHLTSYKCEDVESQGVVCNRQRKNYDILFDLGVGYRLYNFTALYLGAEVQYQQGLTNIDPVPGGSQFNRAWLVNLLLGVAI